MFALLRAAGWKLWLIPIAALVAGGIAYYLLQDDPRQYRATTSVAVPQPAFDTPTPQVVNQAVENFRGALDATSTSVEVADQTGLSASRVRSILDSSRLRVSNVVDVSVDSVDPDDAELVLGAAVAVALDLALQTDVSRVEAELTTAGEELDRAQEQYVEFLIESRLVNPADELRLLRNEAADLRAEAAAARAEGDIGAAVDAEDQAEELTSLLIPLSAAFAEVDAARSLALANFAEVTERATRVQAAASGARAEAANAPVLVEQLPRYEAMARGIAATAALALLLSLMMVLGLQAYLGYR